MKNILLIPALLTAALSTSCSKNDETTPNTPQPGVTYALDGRQMSASGKVKFSTQTTNGVVYDRLTVNTEGKTPSGAYEYVHVFFSKRAGQPDAGYSLVTIYVDVANAGSYYYDTPQSATISKGSSGNWSGTFSGKRVNSQGAVLGTLSNGVFTELSQ